jgi:2-hydroxy-3-oxopropionate reductase
MGRPMAGHLQAAGHELLLYRHRSDPPAELIDGGAKLGGSLAEIAAEAEIIITILPDTPDVEAAMLGANGIASADLSGKLVIDMSSIDPIATRRFADRVRESGGSYLDAPVSGGEVGAKNAALTIMVGGAPEDFARAEPLFAAMGKNITHVGAVGDGQVAKVANQIIVALTIEAVSEGLLFASKAGADPAKVRAALMGGFASSRILELHGERMIARTFDPGFRIDLHRKDLGLALSGARALGLSLPNTATALELFNSCAAHGDGDRDHSAMVTALERLANHQVATVEKA